jgi:hypothetical protein
MAGGFAGTDAEGRVSLGVARIEGDCANYRGVNVWGGKGAINPATVNGKVGAWSRSARTFRCGSQIVAEPFDKLCSSRLRVARFAVSPATNCT